MRLGEVEALGYHPIEPFTVIHVDILVDVQEIILLLINPQLPRWVKGRLPAVVALDTKSAPFKHIWSPNKKTRNLHPWEASCVRRSMVQSQDMDGNMVGAQPQKGLDVKLVVEPKVLVAFDWSIVDKPAVDVEFVLCVRRDLDLEGRAGDVLEYYGLAEVDKPSR